MRKIESVSDLKTEALNEDIDCFILLKNGIRSSKTVRYYEDDDEFHIFNCIDGTEQTLNEAEIYSESNIGEAIDKGAFYQY
jgi:hypothetical protein